MSSKDRSLVRASDIGAWSYCNRAWWLANVRGVEHQHPEQLARGVQAHRQHGLGVQQARQLANIGFLLLLLAIVTAVVALLLWIT